MPVRVQDILTMPETKGGRESKDVWDAYDKLQNGGTR